MMDDIRYFLENNTKPAFLNKIGRFLFIGTMLVALLQGVNNKAFAQKQKLPEGYHIIKNLEENWLVYDNHFKDYIPHLPVRHYNYQSFSQYFEIENFQGYDLFIYPTKVSYLFINGTFQKKMDENNWQQFNIQSLSKKYNNPPKILLTIYFNSPGLEDTECLVAMKTRKSLINISNQEQASLKSRKFSNFQNFSIIFSLFVLSLITVLYNFQTNIIDKYVNLKDLFTIRKRTDSIIVNRPFDIGNILYMVILSFCISLILLVVHYNFIPILPKQIINTENPTFFNLSGQFFNLSFLTLAGFIVKYMLISIFGSLYQLDKIGNLHFFKNLQSDSIFICVIIVALVFLIMYPSFFHFPNKGLYIGIFIIFYILRLFLLFFIIIKAIPVKNLYLFSYLCIVELIPLFIGIRFIL